MRVIFKTLVGSRLYGLELPSSDHDFKAVALPSKQDLLGLSDKAREHWDLVNDNPPGETVVFSVTKFLVLFMSGNPTVTELVFADKKYHVVEADPIWNEVADFAKTSLMSRKIIGSFFGYINDQYTRVKSHKAQNNREWMIEKHGYDIKCASHVYRLAIQGQQLVMFGKCQPTLDGIYRDTCLSIKKGEKTFEETIKLLDGQIALFERCAKESPLPSFDSDAQKARIDSFVYKLHEGVIKSSE